MKFKNEGNLSFFPECVSENFMMTSMLADKSVIVKVEIIMNFMTEIINPPCNSLLAMFFQLSSEVYPKKVSFSLWKLVRPKRTISQLFKLLFPLSPFAVPEKKLAGERGEESPVGGPEGRTEVGGVCETEADTEVGVEDEDEDVDVVGGVDEFGVSGYESEGFTLSEILRRKRLVKKVSEGVVDTVHLPQCEFSNLHHLPLALIIDFSAGQSLISIRLVVLRALKHEDDFVRLLCFTV